MSSNASKGNALEFLINLLEIPIAETIAIGDGDNDYSLIKNAGLGVAMANSSQILKEIANYLTQSNQESGVAVAIFGLIFNQVDFFRKLKKV